MTVQEAALTMAKENREFIKDHEKRIRSNEKFKWFLIGAASFLSFGGGLLGAWVGSGITGG